MRLKPLYSLCAALAGLCAAWAPAALGQPSPSFKATCETVQSELKKLNPPEDELVTIDVVGKLTLVEFDGALAYMGICGSPKPQVMCITYSIEGWKTGDPAVLTGAYNPRSKETVVLDPCLPAPPAEDDLKLLERGG